MKNCSKFEGKILSSHICHKCDIYRQKTCSWCQWNLKFCTQANNIEPKKTAQNIFFTGARNIVKMESEISKYSQNICQIFQHLQPVFRTSHSTRPQKNHILPAAYLNCNWLCCKLPISSWPYSTSPQKYIKSETGQKTIPKYSVWNNYTRRKWVLWWKNSYFPFSIEPDT